jgi:hypothetical protein
MSKRSTVRGIIAVEVLLLSVASQSFMAQGSSAAGTCIYVQDCKRPVSGSWSSLGSNFNCFTPIWDVEASTGYQVWTT